MQRYSFFWRYENICLRKIHVSAKILTVILTSWFMLSLCHFECSEKSVIVSIIVFC